VFTQIFINIILVSIIYCQVYDVGDRITDNHQSIEFNICYGASHHGYSDESLFSLSDLNGNLNGGSYKVLMFDIAASW
tara:strand:- start:6097 stop:6330 length:234 start_codon:yes stop_codon:yes gene_type:complete